MEKLPADIFNIVYPIVSIGIAGNGVLVIQRKSQLKGHRLYGDGRKDREIVKFTPKSMSRLVATINATDVQFNTFLTLTYPGVFPYDGRVIKEDLNAFLNVFRRKLKTEYLWFLEFQERGAPHFHVMTEFDAITPRMRVIVAEAWVGRIARGAWFTEACYHQAGVCPTEDEYWSAQRSHLSKAYNFIMRWETWELIKSEDGAKRYVTQYAVKEYQKKPPAGFEGVGRFWGSSRGVKMPDLAIKDITEAQLRTFLQAQEHPTADWEILPKYLFNVKHVG